MGADGYLTLARVEANHELADPFECIESNGDLIFTCFPFSEVKKFGLCYFSNDLHTSFIRFALAKGAEIKYLQIEDFKLFFYKEEIEEKWLSYYWDSHKGFDPLRHIPVEKIPRGTYLPFDYYEIGTDNEYTREFDIPKTFDIKEKLDLRIWT